MRNDEGNQEIEATAQGGPATVESGGRSSVQGQADAAGVESFSGEIIAISPENQRVTVRNEQGQTRTFTFSENAELTIKENRDPSLWNFKVGYPVRIGHRGDTAEMMMRTDAPEVR